MKKLRIKLITLGLLFINLNSFAQNFNIILGRPTDTSITASVMFDQVVQYYFSYGSQPGIYSQNTPVFTNNTAYYTFNWIYPNSPLNYERCLFL